VCQLHGGDIGVASKSGVGSTFGFFFKIRRSNGTAADGRPAFSSRISDRSNPQRTQTPRPPYSRGNSNLQRVKEQESDEKKSQHNERPQLHTLTSHAGVDTDDVDESLKNPPTEFCPESHPESTTDERYKETESISGAMKTRRLSFTNAIEHHLPVLEAGETERQQSQANKLSRTHCAEPSSSRHTLLLVEDNLINQKVLRRQLQSKGFEVSSSHFCL